MRPSLLLFCLSILSCMAHADMSAFTTGPAIEGYGPVADIDITVPVPKKAAFKHSFDVSKRAADGELNRTLASAARFINMHARAGIPEKRIRVAIVVHGEAVHDVTREALGNAGLVAALVEHGVRIYVCGQSAAYYGVAADELLAGVDMALSAMTAHALLQQEGYTLNPF